MQNVAHAGYICPVMQRWAIDAGKHTPRVVIDSDKGVVLIEGRSYPEEGMDFFDPIMMKMRDLLGSDNPVRLVHLRLEYYNSSTAKALTDIFNILRDTAKRGYEVRVRWEYEEDDDSIGDDIDMFASSYTYVFEKVSTNFL